MTMRRLGQIDGVEKGNSMKQVTVIARLFGVALSAEQERTISCSRYSSQIG
jgi:hypothetical protein